MSEHDDQIAALEARVARERRSRAAAEQLLEQKSLELYEANEQLKEDARVAEVMASNLETSMKELRETQAQLVHASKMESLGTLAGGIAHEINTPIQFINDNLRFLGDSVNDLKTFNECVSGLVEAVSKAGAAETERLAVQACASEVDIDYLMEEFPLAISQSLEGVHQVAQIVQAMKVFSHKGDAEKALADINEAIVSAKTICKNEWKHVAELSIELDPQLPMVLCNIAELNQVFLNIIVNAAQSFEGYESDDAHHIEISTSRKGTSVEIHIKDNGPGIPDDIKARVFDPFFTTKDVGKGTGQGLAISHDIVVKKHGGKLLCESVPGEGTTFVICLPGESPTLLIDSYLLHGFVKAGDC